MLTFLSPATRYAERKTFFSAFADDEKPGTQCLLRPFPRNMNECVGPAGTCLAGGRCEPDNKNEGCSCSTENPADALLKCGAKVIGQDANPCIDPDQPCECNGKGDCKINYLPLNTACNGDEFSSDCEVKRYVLSQRFQVFRNGDFPDLLSGSKRK